MNELHSIIHCDAIQWVITKFECDIDFGVNMLSKYVLIDVIHVFK